MALADLVLCLADLSEVPLAKRNKQKVYFLKELFMLTLSKMIF